MLGQRPDLSTSTTEPSAAKSLTSAIGDGIVRELPALTGHNGALVITGYLRRVAKRPLQRVYNATIRKRLPRKIGYYNGVAVRAPRLFDATDHIPDYKSEQMDCIEAAIESGDTVVNVGGGYGVSTVIASRCVGPSGSVMTFEPARTLLEPLQNTIEMNEVADRVELNHAAVGPPEHTKGSIEGAEALPPSALPECDVLIVDCDGAEVEIIPNLEIRPPDVVIESHPRYGVDTRELLSSLESMGYRFPERYFDGVGGTHHFVTTRDPGRYDLLGSTDPNHDR